MIARDLEGERLALLRQDLLNRLAWLRLADDPFGLYPLRSAKDWPLERLTTEVRVQECTLNWDEPFSAIDTDSPQYWFD